MYFSVLPNFIHNGTIALDIVLPASGPVVISITSIAIWDAANNRYTLNGNQTIGANQVLNLPDSANKLRIQNGYTLTNDGTINLGVGSEFRTDPSSILVNNGTINTSGGFSTYFTIASGATFNNYGTFNNGCYSQLVFPSSTCNNYGIINNNSSSFQMSGIMNNFNIFRNISTVLSGTTNNTGTIFNSGTYGISNNSTFNNDGVVYVYAGGSISNNNVFNNNAGATLSIANGAKSCGVGSISRPAVGSGTVNAECPP